MKDKDILICEISGRRAGTSDARPTEKIQTRFDKVIISNDSNGYITDWNIVNVPQDYREMYEKEYRTADAWLAPMNRSYALKYAKENGYKYCVQVDDNITNLELKFNVSSDGIERRYEAQGKEMFDDFITLQVCALENSNAVVAGGSLCANPPSDVLTREAYCYSFFTVKLESCPMFFQGDFEDDIEYRLKNKKKGLPYVQIVPLMYGKTGAASGKDRTGNREFYEKAKEKRGATMRKLYGEYYSCGIVQKKSSTSQTEKRQDFQHRLKVWRIGIRWTNKQKFYNNFLDICDKFHRQEKDYVKLYEVKSC